jgi:hypothetical protein
MGGWLRGLMDGWLGILMNRRTKGWTDEFMDAEKDRSLKICMHSMAKGCMNR